MAIFMLDCDSVTSTASSINSLVTQFSQIGDSVKGYDTSCEDGFDFAGAKSAIGANLDACTTKVQNTVKLIEGVVTGHTTLQSTFTLDQNGQVSTGTNGTATNATDTGGYTGDNSGGYTGNNNTGGYTPSGGGGYVPSGGSDPGPLGDAPPAVQEPTPENPTDLTQQVSNVSQVSVDANQLDPANRSQFITGMTYNDLGYAMYNDKYVVVCDSSFAKIGDNLVLTRPDGTKVDCVVGALVGNTSQYKGTVSFIVNDAWNAQGANNLTFDMNTLKILNNGQLVK